MRPMLLELQAFGPFAGAERVDFESAARGGPFLIAGPTGAGKTSILDAMCFALYEKSSGHLRDSLEAMRCRQSPWGTDTYVRFTFETQGEVYRFERRLKCKRSNLSQSQSVLRRRADGVFEPLFENCRSRDANDKARELIGLDYEQFRQVVILPQGQFEKFLTSRTEEKEAILSLIFGIRRWSGIAERFYANAKERKDASDERKKEIDFYLRGEGCETPEALAEKTEAFREDLRVCEEEHEKADLMGRRAALEGQRELLRDFERLHALEKERDTLLRGEEENRAAAARLADAERAEALRAPLESRERAGRELQARQRAFEDAEREAARTQRELKAKQEASADVLRALEQTEQALAELRRRYLGGICGELGEALRENEPCPVCGSTQHPRPARRGAGSVGRADLEAGERAVEQRKRDWNAAEREREKAAADCARAGEKRKSALDEREKAAEALAAAETALDALLRERELADAAEAKRLMLPQHERNALRDRLQRLRTQREENEKQLSELRSTLAGQNEPDREALQLAARELQEAESAYQRRSATLRAALTRLEECQKSVDALLTRYQAERGQLESDLAFARVLRGDTGVGLQRYVLGVLFASVIGEANRMLEKVHGGRYRLYRSDARGAGNKRGLELYIHDARAPEDEGRSVSTLSGGEKFLVSLALSIGLSEVAQRGGIRLGTLFIDEGFGSLDEQSIDDALDVLASIQLSSGMVGIISHVSVLYDTLPSKIEVRKSGQGSRIVQTIG